MSRNIFSHRRLIGIITGLLLVSSSAGARVSETEARQLGTELTCIGAEATANADGSIPAFSGQWLGKPPHVDYTPNIGQHPVDPYPADQPLFEITAANMAQYAHQLSDGQQAMFRRYPDTFRIPVYPGRRDFRYPDQVCEISRQNALNTVLTDEGLGFEHARKGGVLFPIPQQPMELFANMNFPVRAFSEIVIRDIADVSSSGSINWGRQENWILGHYIHPDLAGEVFDGLMSYAYSHILLPERDRGMTTVSREPVNFSFGKRLAWRYDPNTRQVRQLPTYGYDDPMGGSSGKMMIDQDRLMNGDPSRFEWSMLGKREMFIPANSYRLHASTVQYADLLTRRHANPDFMRYELRRVWVLVGKLKTGQRHLFHQRVLFIDEDNWLASMSDYYDARGVLWQHAFINNYYAFDISGWHAGSSFYHDLNAGSYIAFNLFQERETGPVLNSDRLHPDQFTPAALRAGGN